MMEGDVKCSGGLYTIVNTHKRSSTLEVDAEPIYITMQNKAFV